MPIHLLVIFIPPLVGIITQITKFLIFVSKHGWRWNYLLAHGHFPSAHSAFAISMLIITAQVEGVESGAFVVAFALAFIIIDDALRLRMYLSKQSRYLNQLVRDLSRRKLISPAKYPILKERIGHYRHEVLAGLIYGAGLTYLLLKLFSVLN